MIDLKYLGLLEEYQEEVYEAQRFLTSLCYLQNVYGLLLSILRFRRRYKLIVITSEAQRDTGETPKSRSFPLSLVSVFKIFQRV